MADETLNISNAAGTCKTLEDVIQFSRTPLSAVTVGSGTWQKREINTGNTFWPSPDGVFALNSLGLPNGGAGYYHTNLLDMLKTLKRQEKRFRFSISPFTLKDLGDMVHLVSRYVDEVEVNESCPNVVDGGKQKDMLGFDFVACREAGAVIRNALRKNQDGRLPRVYAKLPPYSNPADIARAADAHGWADGVVLSNTFPNGFAWDGDKPAITPNGGLAGVSGKAMKPIAMGQVVQFTRIGWNRELIGVGGIESGSDVKDYLQCGASGVQLNTHISKHTLRVIEEIVMQYA